MKKMSILAVVLVSAATLFSSCNKSCGGWYGDRNLRFSDAPTAQQVQQKTQEEVCDPESE